MLVTPVLSISANAGGSARNMKFGSSFNSTNQLIVPEVYTFANSYLPVRSFSYGSNLLMLSAYYSADITYKNYFTISTTGRVDKTSALPNGNNAYFYPSVSLSSAISDYVKLPETITFLKLRGSFANSERWWYHTVYRFVVPVTRSQQPTRVRQQLLHALRWPNLWPFNAILLYKLYL